MGGMNLDARAAALREAFDRTFAAPPAAVGRTVTDLLAVQVGGDPYLIRMAEVGGLAVDRVVTPLPGAPPALAGLAGVRGGILPVYDLAALLGYPRAVSPRWIAVLADAPIAVAVDGFDGYLRRAEGEIAFDAPPPTASRHVAAIARAADFVRPVVSLASMLAAIASRRLDPGGQGA
jgi:purine-binding chemotaxis protein CheW